MTASRLRRLLAAAALVLAAAACLPAIAAAQPGTVRLLGIERYDRVTVTTPAPWQASQTTRTEAEV